MKRFMQCLGWLRGFLSGIRLSQTAQRILHEEELLGEKITNRVRYFFGLLALGPTVVIGVQAGVLSGMLVNLAAFALFFGLTFAHTRILKQGNPGICNRFRYLVIFMDVLVVTVIIVFWTNYKSPDAPAFALKNPTVFFYTLVLVAPVLQFRLQLVGAALVFVLMAYAGMILWTWHVGFSPTNNWREYVMGEGLVVSDVLLNRPVVFVGLALAVAVAIRQSLRMISRIGDAEARQAVLARYFSPSVVEDITRNPEEVRKARRQRVTVLFLDIRDFTRFCENISEEILVSWLTDFRAEMTRAVFDHGGTLDKFIGDAVMATFGTPTPHPEAGEDSRNAVRAARQMFSRLEPLNEKWLPQGVPPVRIGIGLHAGEVVAGNIGEQLQIEYRANAH